MFVKDIIGKRRYYVVVENIQYIEIDMPFGGSSCYVLHFANGDKLIVDNDTYKQILRKLEKK